MSVQVDLKDLTLSYPKVDAPSVDHVSLSIKAGSLFALLGPSGCGKTTTLKMVAGLLDPTSGAVCFDGRPVANVRPELRNAAMVFQKPLLFPHMTIGQNVGFGLRMRRVAAPTIRKRVAEMLDLVRLPDVGDRRPGELSGGQEQRISLARALVTNPAVLLLDEPLSQLDANLRLEMRDLIRQIQSELAVTTIFVTHDQEEAVMLADNVALMLGGQLHQVGKPSDFYERPRSVAVARFFGARNFIPGRVVDGRFETAIGVFDCARAPSDGELMTIRQEAILTGPGPNSFTACVRRSLYLGALQRVWVDTKAGVLEFTTAPGTQFEDGSEVTLRLPAEHVWVLPAEGIMQ